MSPVDAAYIAGFFDGEGCLALTMTQRYRKKDGASVVTVGMIFTIVNTCEAPLDWCVSTIGRGFKVKVKSTKSNPRNLPTFRYNLDCQEDIQQLLPQIRPYLRIKFRQADACLAFLESRKSKRRGSAFTEEEVDLLFELRLANQKSYNKGSREHITYKGTPFTREEFKTFLLAGRDGATYNCVDWTPEMDSLLGTDIDIEVARKLGLKIAAVQRRRTLLGILPRYSLEGKVTRILEMRAEGYKQNDIAEALEISQSSVARIIAKPLKWSNRTAVYPDDEKSAHS